MFRAAVIGHGDFAEGLISAVRQICGRDEWFVPVSNQDYPAEQLEHRVREIVAEGIRVVFTDLPSGSAAIAARRVLRDTPDLTVVSGTNLVVLLEFALHQLSGAAETARIAAAKGQSALLAIPATE